MCNSPQRKCPRNMPHAVAQTIRCIPSCSEIMNHHPPSSLILWNQLVARSAQSPLTTALSDATRRLYDGTFRNFLRYLGCPSSCDLPAQATGQRTPHILGAGGSTLTYPPLAKNHNQLAIRVTLFSPYVQDPGMEPADTDPWPISSLGLTAAPGGTTALQLPASNCSGTRSTLPLERAPRYFLIHLSLSSKRHTVSVSASAWIWPSIALSARPIMWVHPGTTWQTEETELCSPRSGGLKLWNTCDLNVSPPRTFTDPFLLPPLGITHTPSADSMRSEQPFRWAVAAVESSTGRSCRIRIATPTPQNAPLRRRPARTLQLLGHFSPRLPLQYLKITHPRLAAGIPPALPIPRYLVPSPRARASFLLRAPTCYTPLAIDAVPHILEMVRGHDSDRSHRPPSPPRLGNGLNTNMRTQLRIHNARKLSTDIRLK